ncbi:sugar transporter [Dacryopinax primogenitus]|uniref:Sugar transporter n=1 Tax=Dacryopinax primogenitus (strain DJM 731) TaxID=1858805 RepID=M5FYD2_DACPD|nr:sugar transporter [Dacryopinax primogenitus]EJT98561.1 sugar transporter [Dacryopinax primogenitus]
MSASVHEKPLSPEHEESSDQLEPVDPPKEGELTSRLAAAYQYGRPDPFGKGYLRMYLFCSLVYLCSTMNGFDGSLMGSINALPNYTNYYGLPSSGNSSTGIVFAIFFVGQMVGALFIWLADWRGRRLPIFLGCIGVLIGTIVTSTAKTLGVFVGGRFLLSFFATWATTSAPLYMIEMAPPLYRGVIAGLYNTLWYMGSIIATSAVYGAHLHLSWDGELDWRLPLWLQMLCPAIVAIFIWLCPESPRWLIGAGRSEEARQILVKYHANGDENHPLVALEMDEMTESLKHNPMTSWRNFFDLRVLVKTKGRRYRLLLDIAFSWFGQFSGNNIISYYLPHLLDNVGITDVNTQLLLNIIYAIIGWVFAAAGTRFHDVFGRRTMFLGSIAGMIVCLAITAGTAAGYVHTGSQQSSDASIAFIFIFGAVFALAFTSMQPIYPGEVLSNDMRAKGMGIFQLTAGVASFVNTFAAPVALNNIGYWFYVFFVFWDCFEWIIVYFFFVETKGRTLEELDEIFESDNPCKASLKPIDIPISDEKANRV